MTQSGKSFLKEEEQKKNIASNMIGSPTAQREAFEQLKNAQDIKKADKQLVESPEGKRELNLSYQEGQQEPIKVDLTKGGILDEEGYTVSQQNGLTVKTKTEKVNKAKEKVAEKPQLEEEKKILEDITAETELDEGSRLKRATDTFMNKYAPKVFKAGEYLPFVGPMFQLSENMSQKWVNAKEDEVFLSNGKEITSVPKIQDPDLLVDMKDLTKNILLEYGVNGNVVTAQQIKEAYPQYKNISDQVLDNFIGGAIGAYVNGQEIDRDIVGKNYSTMSIMEGYTGERQQELDLITNQDLRKYMSADLQRQIVKDPEALKLIEAYDTVKFYVDLINTQGYNYTDASDRKIANTYRNQALQFEGIMSLDEAMSTIENYDPKRLSTLMGVLQKSYETGIKGEIDKVTLAENHEKLYNAIQDGHAVVQFVNESFDEATDQFLEYVAEQNELEPTALKRTPASWMGDLATKFISGNMRVDNDGNYRNIQGEVVFHRNPDGSYVDKKGRTVQEITGLQKGWIRNEVNALTSVLEGVTKTVEGTAMTTETGDRQYSIQALAGVTSSVVNSLMLAKGQGFFALSSTPGLGRGVDAVFQESMEMGGNVVLAMFDIAQLTNTWTDESKESLKELGGLITVAGLSRKIGNSPYYKNLKEAAKKVRDKHADTYLQVIETSELKNNIKNPKGTEALEDKTGVKEEVDTEGKTIGEIKEELIGEKTEPGKEVKETKTEEKATVKGEKTEEKTTTKEREVVDVTPTLQKIGQSLSINKIVAQRMREDFKNEVSKLNKESESKQALYDVLSSNPKFDGIKNAIFGTPGKIFDATIDAGISILQTVAKAVANAVTGKTGDKKLLRKAYKKMNLAESVVKTIENNPKISQLGKIFHELVGEKGEWKQNIKNIEKYVKERVAEMWEEEARNIQKALEKLKDMAHEFYGNLTTDKKIRFGKFFTGENGIKTVIESRLAPYVKIMEIDGKIYVQIIPGASGYNKIVASLIKRFAKEYNELVEDGRISEKDIESLGDILRKRGNSKDMTVANTGRHLKQALQNYLSKTGEANEWLKAEKAYDAIHSLYKMFDGLYKDTKGGRGKDNEQKPSADKIVKFLEGLSEEQLNMLEEYLPGTKDTIDLLQNGATAVKEFTDRYRKGKEIETFMGQKGKGGMNMRGKAIIINLVDLASWMHNSTLGMVVTGITLGGLLLKGGMTATGRINNILKNKKLRKLLQTALDGDPEAQKQLSEHTEAIQQGVKMVNDAIEEVIEKRTRTPPPDEPPTPPTRPTRTPKQPEGPQGPNRKEYDTSVPNREEYDPTAPIFRNGEEKQQPSEQRDNDMVVSEQEKLPGEQQKRLTDERQYLGYEENPEAKLEQAMADLEIYIKDALETLKDIIDKDDTDDGGDGGDGGNGPTKPIKPTDPDTKEAIDTIDDFIKFVEGNSPVEKSQGEDKPDFKTRSNESLNKLLDKDGNLKEGVPPEYEEEILNELYERQLKKDTTSDNIKDQNTIIRRINEELDKVADHKRKDIEADEFEMDIRQVRGVDQHKAYDIFTDIVDGKIQETDVTQKKTIYEDNQEAAEWIKKRTGEETTPTKSASKTSSLEVWNTKPDTPGKLKALKTQLEKKKKSLPTAKTYKTMKKRQEEVTKLEEEVNRLEKLFSNEEKPQVQPSGKEKSEAKEIKTEEVSEGEESTVFEEMTLRKLLQSDDPEAQDEIKERKSELKVNPKKLYQEMKNALKDEELTSEEAEFYDDVVRKARAETDMSEKHEDMLINIRDEIWKKTHDGLLF